MTTYYVPQPKPRTPEEERIKKGILAYLVEDGGWRTVKEISGEWGRSWGEKQYNTKDEWLDSEWCHDLLGDLVQAHLVESKYCEHCGEHYRAKPGGGK
jgi:hypothetical protein